MEANKTLALSLTQNTPLIATAWSATAVAGLSYRRAPGNSTQDYKINIQWCVREETNQKNAIISIRNDCSLKLEITTIFCLPRCLVGELCQQQTRCKMCQMTGKRLIYLRVTQTTSLWCLFFKFTAILTLKKFTCHPTDITHTVKYAMVSPPSLLWFSRCLHSEMRVFFCTLSLHASAVGVATLRIHKCGICMAAACQSSAPPARRLMGHVQTDTVEKQHDIHVSGGWFLWTYRVKVLHVYHEEAERCYSEGK